MENILEVATKNGIEECKGLKYLSFGCEAENSDKNVYLDTLFPLKETDIEYFGLWGKLLDNNYKVLSETKIKKS